MELDVLMIVVAMDMDIKKYRKSLLLFLLLLLVFVNCQKKDTKNINNVENALRIDTLNLITNVSFYDTGTFALNTLVNHRNFNFSISGTKKNVKESKEITLTKPTVFESYALVNGKTRVQRYLVFSKNDTLTFEFRKNGSVYTGNKKNAILNTLISDNTIYSIEEPDNSGNYIQSLKKKYDNNLAIIKQDSTNYTDFQYKAINDYLEIYFYNKLFNVDFSKITNQKVIEELDKYFDIVNNNILILNRLNAVQNKSLIINLLRYISFKNKNHHLIDNLQFLDKKLFKTEALDGFLLDYMENDNTLSKNDIDIMKKYIRESSLKKATEKSKGKVLSKNILNSTIKDAKLNEVAIKNILSVKNEKLILVDLWATWCVPCLKEIPNWKIAQKKYSDKIKFIRISIDNDQKKWSLFLKKDINDESNYIISNSSHPFIKYFEINSIPRFLLFNNKFEVISDDFDRPSDNNFDTKIKAILDEN